MNERIALDGDLVLHSLAGRCDELLLPWLELYEIAFPPREKMLVSTILALLRDRENGNAPQVELLAALQGGSFSGLVVYARPAEALAHLWYLAVVPEQRSQGLGSRLYQGLVRQLAADTRGMLIEVEIPEEPTTPDPGMARRRVDFYRRQGARVLGGIHYLQSVGPHQPLTPMHVLIHPFAPLSPEEAFAMAKVAFGDGLTQVSALSLE